MSQRTEKVQELAREVLGEAILSLKDPRIGFATVTAVRVTPDLRHARVWISVMGSEEDKKATMAGLESAKPFLRSALGKQVRLRYLPDLDLHLDDGADSAERIEAILHKLHEDEPDRDRREDEE